MTNKAPVSLEAALSCEPILSPVLEFEANGAKVEVKFRELSQTRIDRLRASAIQWVEDERRRKEKSGEWRDVQVDLDAIRANRLDLLMLHAAMVDPKTGGPACSLDLLEKHLSPDVQEFLGQKHEEFRAGLSADSVTPEMVDEFEEIIKKKRDGDLLVSLWTRFGFIRAMSCALCSIDRLSTSRTESSSGISSGDEPPKNPPES